MAEEVELKLALPETAHRAFLRHPLLRRAERLPTRKLVNVYYDTPDLALQRQGIALRTRRHGRGCLQTVKCAGTASGGLAVPRPGALHGAGNLGLAERMVVQTLVVHHAVPIETQIRGIGPNAEELGRDADRLVHRGRHR